MWAEYGSAEAVAAGNPGCALQISAHTERLGRDHHTPALEGAHRHAETVAGFAEQRAGIHAHVFEFHVHAAQTVHAERFG